MPAGPVRNWNEMMLGVEYMLPLMFTFVGALELTPMRGTLTKIASSGGVLGADWMVNVWPGSLENVWPGVFLLIALTSLILLKGFPSSIAMGCPLLI